MRYPCRLCKIVRAGKSQRMRTTLRGIASGNIRLKNAAFKGEKVAAPQMFRLHQAIEGVMFDQNHWRLARNPQRKKNFPQRASGDAELDFAPLMQRFHRVKNAFRRISIS